MESDLVQSTNNEAIALVNRLESAMDFADEDRFDFGDKLLDRNLFIRRFLRTQRAARFQRLKQTRIAL